MTESVSNYDLQVDIGKRIFLQYDQEMLIRKFHLEADERWIYLNYFSTPCRIGRSDEGSAGAAVELHEKMIRNC